MVIWTLSQSLATCTYLSCMPSNRPLKLTPHRVMLYEWLGVGSHQAVVCIWYWTLMTLQQKFDIYLSRIDLFKKTRGPYKHFYFIIRTCSTHQRRQSYPHQSGPANRATKTPVEQVSWGDKTSKSYHVLRCCNGLVSVCQLQQLVWRANVSYPQLQCWRHA